MKKLKVLLSNIVISIMMNNKPFLFILNLFLGTFIVCYTFYVRFLLIRLPKTLYFVSEDIINYKLIIIVVIAISFSVIKLITNFLLVINFNSKKTIVKTFLVSIGTILDNALSEIYRILTHFIPNVYDKVSYFCQKYYAFFSKKPETFFLFILYSIRFIILSAFFIDVFIFFKLNYMYKCLYLLCISIVIDILFYLMKDFASNLNQAKSVLIIETLGLDEKTKLPKTLYSLKDEFKHLDLRYHTEQFILCSKIQGYLDMYQRYSKFFGPYINIITSLLYLIGWCYIIIINLV